jgi:hypothetical protein
VQIPSQISYTTTLPVVPAGIVRIRFQSSMSVHTYSRFVIRYNTLPPGPRSCEGLLFTRDNTSWHHVAATVNHSKGSAVSMNIYVDGAVRASSVASKRKNLPKSLALVGEMGLAIGRSDPGRPPPRTMTSSMIDTSQATTIGRMQGSETFWASGLDEMRLWNVSRTAEEILAGLRSTCRAGRSGAFGVVWPILCFSFDSLDLHRDRDDGNMYFSDLGLAPPVNARAVVGDRFAPSCTTLGDNGALVDMVIASSLAKRVLLEGKGIALLTNGNSDFVEKPNFCSQ